MVNHSGQWPWLGGAGTIRMAGFATAGRVQTGVGEGRKKLGSNARGPLGARLRSGWRSQAPRGAFCQRILPPVGFAPLLQDIPLDFTVVAVCSCVNQESAPSPRVTNGGAQGRK